MATMKQALVCALLCALVLNVNSRYVYKRQYQQQQQQGQGGQYPEQSQGQGEVEQFEPSQEQGVGADDDSEIVQLAVEEAEQNPDIVTADLNNQQLDQLGQDLAKYETELEKESEWAGHKGSVTKEDVEHVKEKYEQKPWYIRLRNWAGRKINELTDKITKY